MSVKIWVTPWKLVMLMTLGREAKALRRRLTFDGLQLGTLSMLESPLCLLYNYNI